MKVMRNGQRGIVQYLVLLILLLGIGAGVYLAQKTQIFKPQATDDGRGGWVETSEVKERINKFFQVKLVYDNSKKPNLEIKDVKTKNKLLNNDVTREEGYRIEILDGDEYILYTKFFNIPNQINDEPPTKESEKKYKPVELNKVNFALTLPFINGASLFKVYSPDDILLSSYEAKKVKVEENKVKFYSKDGKRFKKTFNLWEKLLPQVFAQESDKFVDIVFIGDKFTPDDMPLFRQKVDSVLQHMLTIEPIKTRADDFRFHYIENIASLGCYYGDGVLISDRVIICDNFLINEQINSSGVPADRAVVIVNDSRFGGAGDRFYSSSYVGDWAPNIVIHEFGHTFTELVDEYDYGSFPYARTDKNCYIGTPPNPNWNGIVKDTDYYIGCNYPEWYRSSERSIMRNIEETTFNPISIKIINDEINLYNMVSPTPSPTAQPTSTASPELTPTPSPTTIPVNLVEIIAPVSGTTVNKKDKIPVSVATTLTNVKYIQVFVMDKKICNDKKAPYGCNWKVSNKLNGEVVLKVVAITIDNILYESSRKIFVR